MHTCMHLGTECRAQMRAPRVQVNIQHLQRATKGEREPGGKEGGSLGWLSAGRETNTRIAEARNLVSSCTFAGESLGADGPRHRGRALPAVRAVQAPSRRHVRMCCRRVCAHRGRVSASLTPPQPPNTHTEFEPAVGATYHTSMHTPAVIARLGLGALLRRSLCSLTEEADVAYHSR